MSLTTLYYFMPGVPSLAMVRFTGFPFCPRIILTTSTRFIFFVGFPSILTIRSPAFIPSLKAGVSSIGVITTGNPSFILISIPIPPN